MLPTGTVTILFTDIAGSTRLWEKYPTAMHNALARHDAILHDRIQAGNGQIVKTTGDGVHAVFRNALNAANAVIAIQLALQEQQWDETGPISVRMALHSGQAEIREGDYYGQAVNRAARLLSVASGGQILMSAATAELIQDQLTDEITLIGLGQHKLRSLDRPEHIFQLQHSKLPRDFPALRSTSKFPNNLPEQLTSFIGREKELSELHRLLSPESKADAGSATIGKPRLITLTGPGGTGKTRLSLQVADDVLDLFPDGVWLIELAPLVDPRLVVQAAASTLKVSEQPGRTLEQLLVEHLHERKTLLIFDNCEHVIDACAILVEDLLHVCPHLQILASSREALGVIGEQAYRVRSLALPSNGYQMPIDELAIYEAVRLFVDRAISARSDFALSPENSSAILKICQRLDGIPLAIELAAARVRVLSPEQIADRLDNSFRLLTGGSRTALPRQQTLQALIDWSYDLLSTTECTFLKRLSVFSNGWTLEAAEYVVGTDPIEPFEVLDLLDQLINKSLVAVDSGDGAVRYHLLQTIRQYAQGKLAESDEAVTVRDRHLDYFTEMVHQNWQDTIELRPTEIYKRLAVEGENLQTARAWALEHDLEAALKLAAYRVLRMNEIWPASEALRYVLKVLEAAENDPAYVGPDAPGDNRRLLAAVLASAGTLTFGLGRNKQGLEYLFRSMEIAEQENELMVLAWAKGIASTAATFTGDFELAKQLREQTIDLGRRSGNRLILAMGLINIAGLLEDSTSWKDWEEGMAMLRQGGDRWSQALGHMSAAGLYMYKQDFSEAEFHATRSLELWQEVDDKFYAVIPRSILAELARSRGDLVEAEIRYRQMVKEWQYSGNDGAVARCLECLAFIEHAFADKETDKRAMLLDRAVTLLGAAEIIRTTSNSPMTAFEKQEYDNEVAAIEELVGESAFRKAWQIGQLMDKDQAVQYAVGSHNH